MTFELANKLFIKLQEACPRDTGQLQASIQIVQLSENEVTIVIGNEDGSINGTPSNVYASVTNDAQLLDWQGKKIPNPNYHWVNAAIAEWAKENMVAMNLELE